jgi:hypothetical protein
MEKYNSHNIDVCVKVFLAPVPTKFIIGKGGERLFTERERTFWCWSENTVHYWKCFLPF